MSEYWWPSAHDLQVDPSNHLSFPSQLHSPAWLTNAPSPFAWYRTTQMIRLKVYSFEKVRPKSTLIYTRMKRLYQHHTCTCNTRANSVMLKIEKSPGTQLTGPIRWKDIRGMAATRDAKTMCTWSTTGNTCAIIVQETIALNTLHWDIYFHFTNF